MSYEADSKLVQSFDPQFYSELVETFKGYDTNGNGVIENNEFLDLVTALGFTDVTKQDVDALFKDIDLNNDSVISFSEFLVLMQKLTPKKKRKSKKKA